MDDRRCPFCGGVLLENICIDCGFECLTEEEIAAPYDFAPENDSFGEPESAEDNAEMEGISASFAEAEPETINIIPAANNAAPKAVKSQPYNLNQYNAPQNVPVQNSSVGETIVKNLVEDIKKHWWKMLITMLFPIAGICIGCVYCALGNGTKYRNQDWGLTLKGIGYVAAAALLIKLGIGFGIS